MLFSIDVSRETSAKRQSGRPFEVCRPAVMWGVKEKDMVMRLSILISLPSGCMHCPLEYGR